MDVVVTVTLAVVTGTWMERSRQEKKVKTTVRAIAVAG